MASGIARSSNYEKRRSNYYIRQEENSIIYSKFNKNDDKIFTTILYLLLPHNRMTSIKQEGEPQVIVPAEAPA
jgi:hypothetical protein